MSEPRLRPGQLEPFGGGVLVTGARAPVALHLARLLATAGHSVTLGDSLKYPLSRMTRLAGYHDLPAPRTDLRAYAAAVQGLARQTGITLIIPTCEEVFHLARAVQAGWLDVPVLAPDIHLLAEVHNKFTFINLCARLGLEVPESWLLTTPNDLSVHRDQAADLVFKPVWSRFASYVLIRPSRSDLTRISPTSERPWIAQEALTGEELSVYALAQAGRLTALSAYRSRYRAGKGAGIWFEPVDDAALRAFVLRFVEGTGWSGQISFDLMRLPDGRILPLECNPRATSGLHFFRDAAGFANAMAGGPEVAPDVKLPQTVPLAMWVYALGPALLQRRFRAVRRDLNGAGNILEWPGDPSSGRAQFLALAEIAALALRRRVSLQEASTRDIEWDGEDLG